MRAHNPKCRACPLWRGARRVCMQGEGPDDADIMVIGENPGFEEDAQNRPFVGAAGRLLRPLLAQHAHGLRLYVTNAAKCYSRRGDEKKKLAAVDPCHQYLRAEIARVRPKVILALGASAAYAVTGVHQQISATNGGISWYYGWDQRIPVVLGLHPAFILRSPAFRSWLEDSIKHAVRAAREGTANWPTPWQDTTVHVVASRREALDTLDVAARIGCVSVDVECPDRLHTADRQILCVGFAWTPDDAWVIPEEVYEDAVVRRSVIDLMLDPRVLKIGHNIKYDLHAIVGDKRIKKSPLSDRMFWDTVPAWKLYRPVQHLPAGLESVAWHVGMGGYYEIEFKDRLAATRKKHKCKTAEAFRLVERHWLYRYNGFDEMAAFRAYQKLSPPMEKLPGWRRFYFPSVAVAAGIEAEGIPISTANLQRARSWLNREVQHSSSLIAGDRDVRRFVKKMGKEFNPGSTKQLQAFLFDFMKLKPTKKTKSKKGWAVDEEALEALSSQHHTIALTLRYKRMAKLLSSYIDSIERLVRKDGRMHPTMNPSGAITGRWSASGDAFDKFNPQTIPSPGTEEGKQVRSLFVAPPGYKLLGVDESQVELRDAANLSGDPAMIKAFLSGVDFHTMTTINVEKIITGKNIKPDKVDPEKRRHSKIINFGSLYDRTVTALAKELAIDEADAQRIQDATFGPNGAYKGVNLWKKQQVNEARRTLQVWVTFEGKKMFRRLVPDVVSQDRGTRAHAERTVGNTPIQGSAALATVATLIRMYQILKAPKWRARIILTVHDEILYLVPDDELDKLARLAIKVATQWNPGPVRYEAEAKWGQSWDAMQKWVDPKKEKAA